MAQPCERVTQKLLGVERNRIAALNTLPIHVKKAVRKESVLARFTNIKLQFWSNLLSKHNLNNELSIKYVRKIFRKINISNPMIRTRTCVYQGG